MLFRSSLSFLTSHVALISAPSLFTSLPLPAKPFACLPTSPHLPLKWRSLGTPRIRHQPPTDYPGACMCQPVSRPPLSQGEEMMSVEIKVDSEGKGDSPGTQAKAREGPSFLCDMALGQAGTQTHPWRQRPSDRCKQQERTGESGAFGLWPHPRGSSRISS